MSSVCVSLVAGRGAGSDWALAGVTASEHAGSVSGAGAVGDWKSGCRIGVAGTVCGAVESISSAADLKARSRRLQDLTANPPISPADAAAVAVRAAAKATWSIPSREARGARNACSATMLKY